MPGEFEFTDKPGHILQDHFYGKGGVKLLHLVKNGKRVVDPSVEKLKRRFLYSVD